MAQELIPTFHGHREDVEDAAASAVLFALEHLDCFDARRKDACNYFTSMIQRFVWRRLKRRENITQLDLQAV